MRKKKERKGRKEERSHWSASQCPYLFPLPFFLSPGGRGREGKKKEKGRKSRDQFPPFTTWERNTEREGGRGRGGGGGEGDNPSLLYSGWENV